jgi:pyridoxal phosphate enzyme (YggS family)
MSVAENIAHVRERIVSAARRSGRNPDEISLMAVSKTIQPELIREAYNSGIRQFGESRVQEFAAKAEALGDLSDVAWHMIGHLQTNKASTAVKLFNSVDSVDSRRLAEKLNSEAEKLGKKIPVLIEVNIGQDPAKQGLIPDSVEMEEVLRSAQSLEYLKFEGLMTVPPFSQDPEKARPYFRKLRELSERITAKNIPSLSMRVLSMGMSHDFELAIEEGSTCVRVGSAIFGVRENI